MPKGYRKFPPLSITTNRVKKKPWASTMSKPSGKDLPRVAGSPSEYISSITALRRRDHWDEALYLLQKIASMVKPIMRNHGLRVTTLCEFFPKDSRLLGLNVNHGLKICIRLRRASNDNSFFPLTELLGTMIHELCHNKHGPHDDTFYKYMAELRSELEELMAQGFTGDGFFSRGNTLGNSPFGSRGRMLSGLPTGIHGLADPVKLAEAKRKALLRNEAINKKSNIRGQRLGTLTNNFQTDLSIRELALKAAEQRLADAKWCGKGSAGDNLEDLGLDDDVVEICSPACASIPLTRTASDNIQDHAVIEIEVIDLTND